MQQALEDGINHIVLLGMRANSLEVNYPIYAHALLTTERFVAALAESK